MTTSEKSNVICMPLMPWERRPEEGDDAWVAFGVYRDLAAKERTQSKVADLTGKQVSLIGRWLHRFEWEARAYRYDMYMRDNEREEHVNRVRETVLRHRTLSDKMLRKVDEAVDALDASALEPKDIATWFKMCVEVERAAHRINRVWRSRRRYQQEDDEWQSVGD